MIIHKSEARASEDEYAPLRIDLRPLLPAILPAVPSEQGAIEDVGKFIDKIRTIRRSWDWRGIKSFAFAAKARTREKQLGPNFPVKRIWQLLAGFQLIHQPSLGAVAVGGQGVAIS